MTEAATEKGKRPASQYYWGDWFKDLALQSCSLQSRGLWHEMNCLMHQGEPYGHLTMPNGKPMGPLQLANLCKITPAVCKKLLAELDDNGVFSKAENGAIFSRRMVRDEDLRNRRANGGQAGAEHGIKGAEAGSKGGRPAANKGGEITPLGGDSKPPPSSSSSTSVSPSLRSGDSAADSQRTPSRPKREQTTLAKYLETCKAEGIKPVPDNHAIRAWCVDANIPVEMLQVAWVVFREKYLGDEKLKGKKYKDWPGHFANSVKDRWYALWFIGDDGIPTWTSTGMQRKQVLEAQQAKNHGDTP